MRIFYIFIIKDNLINIIIYILTLVDWSDCNPWTASTINIDTTTTTFLFFFVHIRREYNAHQTRFYFWFVREHWHRIYYHFPPHPHNPRAIKKKCTKAKCLQMWTWAMSRSRDDHQENWWCFRDRIWFTSDDACGTCARNRELKACIVGNCERYNRMNIDE